MVDYNDHLDGMFGHCWFIYCLWSDNTGILVEFLGWYWPLSIDFYATHFLLSVFF